MAIEKYIAAASLGLFIMFVAEILTLFNYIINPPIEIDAPAKIFMFISIGIAPALVLTGTSFGMVGKYGDRTIGAMIIAGGAILLAGMFYANSLLPSIDTNYLVYEVEIVPPLFMAISIPVIVVGSILYKAKKRRPIKVSSFERSSLENNKRRIPLRQKSMPCIIGFHDLCPVQRCKCTCHID